jgi:hypothetical protein
VRIQRQSPLELLPGRFDETGDLHQNTHDIRTTDDEHRSREPHPQIPRQRFGIVTQQDSAHPLVCLRHQNAAERTLAHSEANRLALTGTARMIAGFHRIAPSHTEFERGAILRADERRPHSDSCEGRGLRFGQLVRLAGGTPPLSPHQSITVRDAIEAYTLNGARMLNLQSQAGSIEVGKSADFIVVDQDILALADNGHPDQIATTHVVTTWFQGKKVYTRPGTR